MDFLEWATSPWGQSVPIHIAWFLIWVAMIAGLLFLRSEEHTSELQSHLNLVCRLLLEKKKSYKFYAGKNLISPINPEKPQNWEAVAEARIDYFMRNNTQPLLDRKQGAFVVHRIRAMADC